MSVTSQQPSVAESLVDIATSIRAEALPSQTVETARRMTLQVLGIARLGLQNPIARDSVEYAAKAESGTAATIVGHGLRSGTASSAAFANAVAAHSDFREDTHAESSSHPGVAVIPAALAAAEARGGSLPPGRFIEAIVAGYEVIGRVAKAATMPTIDRGFRPPSVYTVFGGTVAAGLVLGLDRARLVNAIAISAQGASGVTHPFLAGTDEWFLAPAFAARQAVASALMAAQGVVGSRTAIEGEEGVWAAFAGDGRLPFSATPAGTPYYEIEHAPLKRVLTCAWNQSLVYQLSRMSAPADRVRAIRATLSPIAAEYPGVSSPGPFSGRTSALISAAFAAALQVVRGSLDHASYERLDDPEVLRVARLVQVEEDPALAGYATRVEVELDDGTTLRSEDGNDDPGFSLKTVDQVLDTLRRNYTTAGLEVAHIDRLAAGVETAFATGSVESLANALA